ncbi:MAG: hypothetical protein ACYSU0_05475 [Planctomycetota bacterium]|jgi:hypothetical protein
MSKSKSNRTVVWLLLGLWTGINASAWLRRDKDCIAYAYVETEYLELTPVKQGESEGLPVEERFRTPVPGGDREDAVVVKVDEKWLDGYGWNRREWAKVNVFFSVLAALAVCLVDWLRGRRKVQQAAGAGDVPGEGHQEGTQR